MSIFSFLKKNNLQIESEFIISGTTRDYSTFNHYDKCLKVWLPEAVKITLDEMSEFSETPISDIIRRSLYIYLYGQYDLMSSIEKGRDEFAMKGSVAMSASPEYFNRTAELGKNNYDVKVWIAMKMKRDLQNLADKSGLKLSEFTREILISNLFGHTYLSERDEMVNFRIEID